MIRSEARSRPGILTGQISQLFTKTRLAAIHRLGGALSMGAGPIALTGESGAGKSWLVARLREQRSVDQSLLQVTASPSLGPDDFWLPIREQLGMPLRLGARSNTGSRIEVARMLQDECADGRSHALIIEDAHRATGEVLELIRLLGQSIQTQSGFAAIVLVGQTSLLRILSARKQAGLNALITEKIHLAPIDADEAAVLLRAHWPERIWSDAEVERLHRDAAGNPRALLTLARAVTPNTGRTSLRPADVPNHVTNGEPKADAVSANGSDSTASNTADLPWVPSRPVDEREENVIEVGWTPIAEEPTPTAASQPTNLLAQRVIDDPYAVLQSVIEAEALTALRAPDDPVATLEIGTDDDSPEGPVSEDATGIVWPDAPHPFEPYGDLFKSRSSGSRTDG